MVTKNMGFTKCVHEMLHDCTCMRGGGKGVTCNYSSCHLPCLVPILCAALSREMPAACKAKQRNDGSDQTCR